MPTVFTVVKSVPPLGTSFRRRWRLSRISCLMPDDCLASSPIAWRVCGRFSIAVVTWSSARGTANHSASASKPAKTT